MTRVLVCGSGSIGRRHATNLKALGAEVALLPARPERADAVAAGLGVAPATNFTTALATCDATVVASATDHHMLQALEAARSEKALFVEKPLSHDREGVADLRAACAGRVVEIGCQLRAHPGLQVLRATLTDPADGPLYAFRACVGQRLDGWRPGTDYRAGYSADARRGGGALFDLAHEVDLMHWLAGPMAAVSADLSTISDLGIAADDLANLTLTTVGGAVGQVQLDMLSPVYRRDLQIVRRHAVYDWDYGAGRLTRRAPDGTTTLYEVPAGFERNDMFLNHMRHFLARIADPTLAPLCGLDDGIAVLDVLLAARRSQSEGRRIRLNEDLT